MEVEYIIFVGVFLGCLMRTTLPYLRKLKENPELNFEWKYFITFGFNVLASFVATIILMPSISVESGEMFTVFSTAFVSGWGAQDLLNNIIST